MIYAVLFVAILVVGSIPLHSGFNTVAFPTRLGSFSALRSSSEVEAESSDLNSIKSILYRAADTKQTDGATVISNLLSAEKLVKSETKKRAADDFDVTSELRKNLAGTWRLIFTTGTLKTQQALNTRINYFPLTGEKPLFF